MRSEGWSIAKFCLHCFKQYPVVLESLHSDYVAEIGQKYYRVFIEYVFDSNMWFQKYQDMHNQNSALCHWKKKKTNKAGSLPQHLQYSQYMYTVCLYFSLLWL